ncbi:MAG: deoxyribose-phosphate aldolase [Acholeplasmatales bacterium]|nr:deoxyribose-phosphate aldolase [Acholeplasmatales bacterium]
MDYNKFIDHTNLKPNATKADIIKLCSEANYYNFKSVCVNPSYVSFAKELLNGTDVLVCTVIGFPLGQNLTEIKAYETTLAIRDGASEVDMVINNGALKDKDYDYVKEDIKAVVKAADGVLVKVIIETSLLTSDEIVKACELVKQCGADFVKTSTGFIGEGAKAEDIKLMRETVGSDFGVKASGGIKNRKQFEEMISNGATRIGTSNGVSIMEEYKDE